MEGAAVFALVLYLYHSAGTGWELFPLLFLWPDLFMLGDLANVRLGSAFYNLAHLVALPVALVGLSLILYRSGLLPFALIWLAHIEWDRALGHGRMRLS
jgi:hypothetical protein